MFQEGTVPCNYLGTIEKEIHSRKNRVRHAMNGALISIGFRRPSLTKQALAAAKRIGKVEVDHGETGCKTRMWPTTSGASWTTGKNAGLVRRGNSFWKHDHG